MITCITAICMSPQIHAIHPDPFRVSSSCYQPLCVEHQFFDPLLLQFAISIIVLIQSALINRRIYRKMYALNLTVFYVYFILSIHH